MDNIFESYLEKAQNGVTPKKRTQKEFWAEAMEGFSGDPIPATENIPSSDDMETQVAKLLGLPYPHALGGNIPGFIVNMPQTNLIFGWANGPLGYDLECDGHVIESGEMDNPNATPEEQAQYVQEITNKFTGSSFDPNEKV